MAKKPVAKKKPAAKKGKAARPAKAAKRPVKAKVKPKAKAAKKPAKKVMKAKAAKPKSRMAARVTKKAAPKAKASKPVKKTTRKPAKKTRMMAAPEAAMDTPIMITETVTTTVYERVSEPMPEAGAMTEPESMFDTEPLREEFREAPAVQYEQPSVIDEQAEPVQAAAEASSEPNLWGWADQPPVNQFER